MGLLIQAVSVSIFLLVSMISQFLFIKYKAKLSDYVEVFTIISDVGH